VLDEHSSVPDVLLIGEQTWQRLSDKQQAAVMHAARVSAEEQKQLWREATDEALTAVREAGVEVIVPDKQPFREQVEELLASNESDATLAPWLRRIVGWPEGEAR
jgi:TRAP-type C4-dicarboxylate transport system substrate-binding protein